MTNTEQTLPSTGTYVTTTERLACLIPGKRVVRYASAGARAFVVDGDDGDLGPIDTVQIRFDAPGTDYDGAIAYDVLGIQYEVDQ